MNFIRLVGKKQFFGVWKVFFCKAELLKFHESNAEKLEPEKLFFLQSHACMNFTRLVCKKQFFGAWKIVFLQSLRVLQAIEENNVSGPHSLPTNGFWVDWKQSKHVRKKIGAWKIVFLQSPISSRKTIWGVTPKKWTAKGNCKPHV